jgi:hypothetical protein
VNAASHKNSRDLISSTLILQPCLAQMRPERHYTAE